MTRTDPDAPINNVKDDGVPSKYTGLTKREYFAAQALKGLLSKYPDGIFLTTNRLENGL